jgi:Tol biopolymer transport system component
MRRIRRHAFRFASAAALAVVIPASAPAGIGYTPPAPGQVVGAYFPHQLDAITAAAARDSSGRIVAAGTLWQHSPFTQDVERNGIALARFAAGGGPTLGPAPSGGATFPGLNGRIVFASARADQPGEGNSEVYELDAANGTIRDVSRTTAYDDNELAVSPDGSRIAVARAPIANPDSYQPLWQRQRLQLWVMNSDGSNQQRLGNLDFYSVSSIVWSGDGKTIAFLAASDSNAADHLWVAGADAGGPREVTTFPTASARWAPDGSELAFVGLQAPAWDIGFVGANGADLHWLAKPPDTLVSAATAPTWSPDGKELAFFGSAGASPGQALLLVGADGSGLRTLTRVLSVNDLQWLPSGEIGLVERDSSDPREYNSHVEVIRPDGSGLRTVDDSVPRWGVTWAPAGDRLVFLRTSPRRELVVDTFGGARRIVPLPGLLATSSLLNGGPAWSPDGASLYVAGTVALSDTELYTVTPQGGDLRQLTRNRVNDLDPAWSPDGQRIAFTRQTIDRHSNVLSSVWLMAADGTHVHRLTTGGSPSWAPDNARLAFARRGRVARVAVIDTRTGNTQPVVNGVAPAWSPDGRLIAFIGSYTRPLWVVRPDGTGERSLFDRSQLEPGTRFWSILGPTWSPDGRQIAFTMFFYGKLNSFGERQLVVPRAGGPPKELSCDPSSAPPSPVRWSPDGSALVASGGGEVWVCPLDGSAPYRLSDGIDPDWQPDGAPQGAIIRMS